MKQFFICEHRQQAKQPSPGIHYKNEIKFLSKYKQQIFEILIDGKESRKISEIILVF